jgi:hypothetical protein
VAKHRNSLTGYAKINEEFVCGRKYCSGCLKDNYGKDWMKANNGLCPFCLALCSCTRCLRNEKMNKLKAFFLSLGGDLNALQQNSLLDQLPSRREEPMRPKYKPRKPARPFKSKRIAKDLKPGEKKGRVSASKDNLEEDTERWESTAEKEVAWVGRRGARRRALGRIY